MTDRLPSVDAETLLERYDRLVTILSDAAPDEGARAATKSHIIALFRDVERALAELTLLRDDVKELVVLWKVQPVLEPAAPALAALAVATPARPDGEADEVPVTALLDPDALEAAVRAQTASGATSVRFDYLGASTYVAKGWSAISIGAYVEGERALRRAIELAPDDKEAGALLGWSLMGQDRLGEAMVPLREVLAADPEYSLARVSVGYVQFRLGNFGDAIEHLVAVARGADDRKAVLYAHYWLGLVYQRREMHEDALGYFRQALALGPNLLQAYYEMGRVLWRMGDRDAALDAWRAGAAANKFNAWGKRCDEVRKTVEQGGEPLPLD